MSASDVIVVSLFSSLGGALSGAFFGAWLQNKYEIKNRERRIHRNAIKQKCLIHLKKSLDNFWVAELIIEESTPFYEPTVADSRTFDRLVASYENSETYLMMRAAPEFPDALLFEDLKNHYDFKESLDKFNSGLEGKYGDYQITKLKLYSRIYQFLNENVAALGLSSNANQLKMYAQALYFECIQKPEREWPRVFSDSIGVRGLFGTWPRAQELRALGDQFRKQYEELKSVTIELTGKIERAINSQRSLKGSCEFLD